MRTHLPNLRALTIFVPKTRISYINSSHIIYHIFSGLDDNYLL